MGPPLTYLLVTDGYAPSLDREYIRRNEPIPCHERLEEGVRDRSPPSNVDSGDRLLVLGTGRRPGCPGDVYSRRASHHLYDTNLLDLTTAAGRGLPRFFHDRLPRLPRRHRLRLRLSALDGTAPRWLRSTRLREQGAVSATARSELAAGLTGRLEGVSISETRGRLFSTSGPSSSRRSSTAPPLREGSEPGRRGCLLGGVIPDGRSASTSISLVACYCVHGLSPRRRGSVRGRLGYVDHNFRRQRSGRTAR